MIDLYDTCPLAPHRAMLLGTMVRHGRGPITSLLSSSAFVGALMVDWQARSAAESTFERCRGTKAMRRPELPRKFPYFAEDLGAGEWSSPCIETDRDTARVLDLTVEYVELTQGSRV